MLASWLKRSTCHACGNTIEPGQWFCRTCGRGRGINGILQFKKWELIVATLTSFIVICLSIMALTTSIADASRIAHITQRSQGVGISSQPTLHQETIAPTHQQTATKVLLATPSTNNDLSPEAFIRNYFDAINSRDYDSSWSMLSSKFQENHTYNEYASFWNTVDKVEILSINVRSQSTSQVLIYVEAHYYYKNDVITTGHTAYKLIKDGNSWLFDPN